ncbi:MAG: c-type cytochrome [Alphaproteobacteria bacterium]|nr:c-type cytochrome [Alphaproteobacteria bacterium]
MLRAVFAIGVAALLLVLAQVSLSDRAQAQQLRWRADYFPNVALTDHNGRTVRFYDHMIRGKVVAINFVYTTCTDLCPLDTAQLRRVHEALGDRVGRDIFFYSISVDSENDTPVTLRRFMRLFDVGPGWTFLTGSRADVELLQRRLGIRPPDPRNLREHDTRFIMGNERTGQWIRRSSYEDPQLLANILAENLNNHAASPSNRRQSYTQVTPAADNSRGAYLFRTRCSSCHTIGGGDRLGPDLRGVADARPHAWLNRWLREPDRMIAERDPTALALMRRYRNVPMPNLGLTESDANHIIDYMRRQDVARTQAASAPGGR